MSKVAGVFPAFLLILVITAQLNAPFGVLPWGLEVDLALIVAVYGGLTYRHSAGAALGFAAGLLQELLAGGLLGVGALSKGLTGLLWARWWQHSVGEGLLAQWPLLAILTLVDGGAFFLASKALSSAPAASWDVFAPMLGRQLVSNLLLGPLLLRFFAVVHRKLRWGTRARWGGHEPTLTLQSKRGSTPSA